MARRLLCLKEVCDRTSLARATIYRMLEESKVLQKAIFPLPVQVSKGRVGWHESEIDEWIRLRPRANIDAALAALFAELNEEAAAAEKAAKDKKDGK